jgi:SAM-dependent methyltransferase
LLRNIPRPMLISLSLIFGKFASFFYRGNRFECPVCKGRFRKFLPYGYIEARENALCPGCLSLERHRLLWLYLQNRTRMFTDELKVLHIAPEQCFHKRFRKMKNLAYTTADLDSPIADVRLDVQSMPFNNDTFDIVICNHVLEHVADDKKALSEIFRALKRGGFAIMQVPTVYDMEATVEDPSVTDPAERQRLFRQKDHYRLYGKDYLDRVMAAGFIIGEENFLNTLSIEDRDRYRLPEMEYMYAYFKP